MRTLEGSNRVRNGMMGIILLVIAIGVGQSFASVPMLFATPTYYAQFSDTGGLNKSDKVRIAGVDVGKVRSMTIDGDKVVIGFGLDGTQIGKGTRASIKASLSDTGSNERVALRSRDRGRTKYTAPVAEHNVDALLFQRGDAFNLRRR